MFRNKRFAGLLVISSFVFGCSDSAPTTDDAAFRAAIGQYLQANNMAMTIKEVKDGPNVRGDTATLTASMTHEKLGGPSVTWDFRFSKRPDGSWEVTQHK
jgi:hypothetical protein